MKYTVVSLIVHCVAIIQAERFQLFYDYLKQYQWPTLCLTGERQSPINIQFHKSQLCPNHITYQVTKPEMGSQIIVHHIQNTKDLENPFQEQTFIKYIQNTTQVNFKSLQFHWHSPSQHTVNGNHFDLQLHIVHKSTSSDDRLAVTGLLFNMVSDATRTVFSKLNLAEAQKNFQQFPFQLNNKFVFHYKGSLTTPPCSEIVDWFVYLEPYEISKFELQKIKAAKNNGQPNARKVQKLNQRQIYFLAQGCPKS